MSHMTKQQPKKRNTRVWCALALVLGMPVRSVWADDAAREHDGFFLRLALGGAGLSMSRTAKAGTGSSAGLYTGDSSIAGGSGAYEISVGGTLARGLVLAGTLFGHGIANPTLKRDGGADVDLDGPLHFGVLGATLEYFPNPQRGFHFGGTLGFAAAWAKSPNPAFSENLGGFGGAISLSAGYLWWVGRTWSVGVLGRLTGARLHGEHEKGGITGSEDDSLGAFGVYFSGAYH